MTTQIVTTVKLETLAVPLPTQIVTAVKLETLAVPLPKQIVTAVKLEALVLNHSRRRHRPVAVTA